MYHDIKLTTKRFRWKANDWIASTDSEFRANLQRLLSPFTLRLKGLKTTGDCKGTTDMMRLIVRTHKSCRWCLIEETIVNRGTQRPHVSKYARRVLEACSVNLELP